MFFLDENFIKNRRDRKEMERRKKELDKIPDKDIVSKYIEEFGYIETKNFDSPFTLNIPLDISVINKIGPILQYFKSEGGKLEKLVYKDNFIEDDIDNLYNMFQYTNKKVQPLYKQLYNDKGNKNIIKNAEEYIRYRDLFSKLDNLIPEYSHFSSAANGYFQEMVETVGEDNPKVKKYELFFDSQDKSSMYYNTITDSVSSICEYLEEDIIENLKYRLLSKENK